MAVKFLDETFTHEGRQWRRITAEADERWVLSVDLGQAADFTAISLLHHRRSPLETFAEIRHPNGRGSLKQNVEQVIDVRHLERLKLHTPYPDQVAYVAELLARPPLNQTGCVDHRRRAGGPMGAQPVALRLRRGRDDDAEIQIQRCVCFSAWSCLPPVRR